jgi:autophagy-related protein 5
MANDREVLKVVWDGKIPMKFIAEDDLELQESDLFFLLVPRVTYLPLITDKVSSMNLTLSL